MDLQDKKSLLDLCAKSLDSEVLSAIEMLESNGFMAFLVGGCVRDILLEKKPKDYDIATNATPNEILEIFHNAGHKCLEIGKKYGTISISKTPIKHCKKLAQNPPQNKQPSDFIEVTTFRKDSEYIDGRHPKSVEFGDNIMQDLARRDFTINAIAFSPSKRMLIDTFGGLNDITSKTISCVGNPNIRFSEDYLRILRALRFSSTLGFRIECGTKSAIKAHINKLDSISKERINAEFSKLLLGDFACEVLSEFSEVLGVICKVDFLHSKILDKIILLKQTPKDLILRLGVLNYALFGRGSNASKKAKSMLRNLRYNNDITASVCFLLDFVPSALECVRKNATQKITKNVSKNEQSQKIALKMLLKDCDKNADFALKKAKTLLDFVGIICEKNLQTQVKNTKSICKQIMDSKNADSQNAGYKECFCLSQLAIKGDEVKSILQNQNAPQTHKIQDKHIGKILDFLLLSVIKEQIPNEKVALKEAIINYLKSKGQKC